MYWTDFLTLFVILCGVLYHGIFIIFLFLWTGLFILSHFKEFYERHQLLPWGIAATLFILLAVQMDQIRNYAVYAWQVGLEIIRNFILLQWNLLFPAYYINIDNIQVGWSGFLGVAKYYGFYAGPGILFGLVFLLVLHQGSWAFRREITSYLANRRLWFIWGACLFFFVIAEVLPRFADFSFLPDRALNFFGIFCVLPLFVTLQYLDSRKSPSPWGLFGVGMVFSLLVSVAGAMYVSYQFKFLSTEQERVAHEWVEANLPENRVFYTTGSDERLSYHSDSLAYPLNPEKIQQRDLENLLRTLSVRVLNERITFLEQEIENIRGLNITEKINVSYVPEDRILANEELFDQLLSVVEAQKIAARNADRYLEELEDLKQKINRYNNIYIFVSAPDPRNPYSKRPYLTAYSNTLYEEENAFYAEHPEYFVRVYEENGVSIWKFKGLNGAPLP